MHLHQSTVYAPETRGIFSLAPLELDDSEETFQNKGSVFRNVGERFQLYAVSIWLREWIKGWAVSHAKIDGSVRADVVPIALM